jgi:hypothetical protein
MAFVGDIESVCSFVASQATIRGENRLALVALGGVAVAGHEPTLTVRRFDHRTVDSNATLSLAATQVIAAAVGGAVAVAGYKSFDAVLLNVHANMTRTIVEGGRASSTIAFALCGFSGVLADALPMNNGTLLARNITFLGEVVDFSHVTGFHSTAAVFGLALYSQRGLTNVEIDDEHLWLSTANITCTNPMYGSCAVAGIVTTVYDGAGRLSNLVAANTRMSVLSSTVQHEAKQGSLSVASVAGLTSHAPGGSFTYHVSGTINGTRVDGTSPDGNGLLVAVAAVAQCADRVLSTAAAFQAFVLQTTINVTGLLTVAVGGVAYQGGASVASTSNETSRIVLVSTNSSVLVRAVPTIYRVSVVAVGAFAFVAQSSQSTPTVAVDWSHISATVCSCDFRVATGTTSSVALAGGLAVVAHTVTASVDRAAFAVSSSRLEISTLTGTAVAVAGLAVLSTATVTVAAQALPVWFRDVTASNIKSAVTIATSGSAAVAVCGLSVRPAGDAAVQASGLALMVSNSTTSFACFGTTATAVAAISFSWVNGVRRKCSFNVSDAFLSVENTVLILEDNHITSAFGVAGVALVRPDDGPGALAVEQVIARVINATVTGRWVKQQQAIALASIAVVSSGAFDLELQQCWFQSSGGRVDLTVLAYTAAAVGGIALSYRAANPATLRMSHCSFSSTDRMMARLAPFNDVHQINAFSVTAFGGIAIVGPAFGASAQVLDLLKLIATPPTPILM